jgi:hypothetical protein
MPHPAPNPLAVVPPTPAEETIEQKIARLTKAREERDEAARLAALAHQALCLELDDRFSRELGPRGQAWELVNEDNTNGEGPIVVKLGDPVAHKLWQSKPGAAPEDAFRYVEPSVVYPAKDVFTAIVNRRPQLLLRATAAVTALFGFSEGVLRGKY